MRLGIALSFTYLPNNSRRRKVRLSSSIIDVNSILHRTVPLNTSHLARLQLRAFDLNFSTDYPEEVVATEIDGGQSSMIEKKVAEKEMGKVIGMHRRTVQAIRTVLNAASGKLKKQYFLELLEQNSFQLKIQTQTQYFSK